MFIDICIWLHSVFMEEYTLQKKWGFLLTISLVNVNKYAEYWPDKFKYSVYYTNFSEQKGVSYQKWLAKPVFLNPSQKQPPEVFCKRDVLESFTNFTGKDLCLSLF